MPLLRFEPGSPQPCPKLIDDLDRSNMHVPFIELKKKLPWSRNSGNDFSFRFRFRFQKYPLWKKSCVFSGTRNIKVVAFRFRFYPKRSSFFGKSFFWDICVYLIFIIWYGLIYPSISPVGYITPSPIQPNLTSDHHMGMKTKRIFWDLPEKKWLKKKRIFTFLETFGNEKKKQK